MKSYLRFLNRNKQYAAIQVVGLSISLAFVIVLTSWLVNIFKLGRDAASLEERIKFTDMPKLIERAMEKATYILKPTLDDYLETDREIRAMVSEWI